MKKLFVKTEYQDKEHVVSVKEGGVLVQKKVRIPNNSTATDKLIKDLVRQGVPVSFFDSESDSTLKMLKAIAGSANKKQNLIKRKAPVKTKLVVKKKGFAKRTELESENQSLKKRLKALEAKLESGNKATARKPPVKTSATAAKKT